MQSNSHALEKAELSNVLIGEEESIEWLNLTKAATDAGEYCQRGALGKVVLAGFLGAALLRSARL